MLLNTLLTDVPYDLLQGSLNKNIQSITYDSREVKANSVFVAITGFSQDGHQYIHKAIELGATVILVEKNVTCVDFPDVTFLKVANTRKALALLSANLYDHPGDSMELIGITGTNGKTSTTYLLKSILEQAEQTHALIGTTGVFINDQKIDAKTTTPTTPESLELQQILCEMKNACVSTCMMEVSSHALHLHRVDGLHYDIGVFMNLTPDHLEMHKTMEDYFQAKAMLFDLTSKYNIINVDDPYGKRLVEKLTQHQAKTITFGIHNEADIYPSSIEYSLEKTTFTVHTPTESAKMTIHIPGEIYVYNSLAAIASALSAGIPMKMIQKGLAQVKQIKGRLEVAYSSNDLNVVIDFAHTEDSLKNALQTLKPHVKGKLILVFGVYADMSKSGEDKRLGMGTIAAKYADFSIVTSDNPKLNDPEKILHEVSQAVQANNGSYKAILDRKKAIEYAIEISEKNDMILIAGKGHETTQVIGTKEIPFNEKEIVLDAIEKRKFEVQY